MDSMVLGIIYGAIGFTALLAVCAGLCLLCMIYRAVIDNTKAVLANTAVNEKAADTSAALVALVGINRKLVSSTERMTAAVQTFTALVLKNPEDPDAPALPPTPWEDRPRGPMGRPPIPPLSEDYAADGESGTMHQSDEDLAEIEAIREALERGQPTADQILNAQQPEDVRGSV